MLDVMRYFQEFLQIISKFFNVYLLQKIICSISPELFHQHFELSTFLSHWLPRLESVKGTRFGPNIPAADMREMEDLIFQ